MPKSQPSTPKTKGKKDVQDGIKISNAGKVPLLEKGALSKLPPGGLEVDPDDIPDAPTFSEKAKQWALSMLIKLIFFIGKVIAWFSDHKYLIFFFYSMYLAYKWYKNDQDTKALVDEYTNYNIQGIYYDPIIHQTNIFNWKSPSIVVRTQQGLNTSEQWSFDKVKKRFVVGSSINSKTANYVLYNSSTKTLTIYSAGGVMLSNLTKMTYTSTTCNACAHANTLHPTYGNFNTSYTLAKVRAEDQLAFSSQLDTLRVCGTYNMGSIPVGAESNLALSRGPIAIAKDGSCFYSIPSTNYTILLSNHVVEQTVTLADIPVSYCGSM